MKRIHASPLRYPGGKGALYPLVRDTLRMNNLCEGVYVEPYAGGAGLALSLLFTGEVSSVVINDLDPAIHAFWKSVTGETDRFIRKTLEVPITIEEWVRQKEVYANANDADTFDLGFATFFLNRTNRSGVLNGGPIGGKSQTGKYKIDARFNRKGLSERIRLIGLHATRIAVSREDGKDIIAEYSGRERTLVYADPPYYEKSGTLYMNKFASKDHKDLADLLNSRSQFYWILTYDDAPQIEVLYRDRKTLRIPLRYSANGSVNVEELLVHSDGLQFPDLYDRL